MNFRHEWKHQINQGDLLILRQRLRAVARPDGHGINGRYFIRSLYFDTPWDTALREKLDGVDRREKYRIRFYNGDTSLIHLEKKSRINGLCRKDSAELTYGEAQAIAGGAWNWMADCGRPLVEELYRAMTCTLLGPRTIVDYTREAFVYGPGNVRVTLDCDLRTGLGGTDFLSPHCVTIPAGDAAAILEVKWDQFLPSVIRDAVQLENRRASSFSKYAACRMYG